MRLSDLHPAEKRALLRRLLDARAAQQPLSCGQKALYFLAQLEATGAAYNLAFAARVRGQVDPRALRRALQALVDRHGVLRATFACQAGLPYQVQPARAEAWLEVETVSGADDEALRERCLALAQAPFDLERGPLLRAHLLVRGADQAVLFLGAHHLIGDYWSLALLLEELGRQYRAAVEGRDLAAAPPAAEYADFVRWQRELLASERGAGLEAYWREELAGALTPLDLPCDRPRPARPTNRAGAHAFRVPAALAEQLSQQARDSGVTLFALLLTGWQVLLARHSGHGDFLVGAPVAGRERPEFREVVGFFVNMVALRARLADDPTWRTALERSRATLLGALAHQAYPFARLVERLAPTRDDSRPPLLQATLVLHKRPDSRGEASPLSALTRAGALFDLGGLRLESLGVDSASTQFELTLFAEEDVDGSLAASLVYKRDLFSAQRAAALARRWLCLLESGLREPDARVSRLRLSPADEMPQPHGRVRDAGVVPAFVPLHVLIAAQARATPEAVAVRAPAGAMTYADVERRVRRLAHALRAQGLRPGDRVALHLPRAPELVVGLLAVLAAGAAFVPLDSQAPPERNAALAADAGVGWLLTSPASDAAPCGPWRRMRVDEHWQEGDEGELDAHPTPQALAYVLYTSGSSGRPKGVMVPHGALHNHMLWMARRFPLGPGERVLQRTPATFDASVWEFFAPLLQGAELVLAPHGMLDAARLASLITEWGVTTLQVVPALLRGLVEEPEFDRCHSLRRVFCGGESLPAPLIERFRRRSAAELVNLYGPTETCIDATAWVAQPGEPVRIGRPIDGLDCLVVDLHGQPLPSGAKGELYIGGRGLAHGYLGSPGLTAERFVPHPWPTLPGDRLYRTGDRAAWDDDGQLEYHGRVDRQIKLHGVRLEPQEIEHALMLHPHVRQAAVTCLARDGAQHLVAYVVPRDDGPFAAEQLRRFLLERLPAALVPTLWVELARLPLTSSGKVDHAALPPPSYRRPRDEEAPRTPVEATLATVWAEVLGLGAVGRRDDFFALGGDSLLGLQVVARARQVGLTLSLEALLRHPTVAELADAASCSLDGEDAGPLVLLQPVGAAPPLFCVHGSDGGAYVFAALARLLGEDRPVYGLAARGSDGEADQAAAPIEALAAGYVAAVRAVQPRGPYHVLGWSLGAIVAYEMAHQWRRAGESVAFVGLIDQGPRPHDWSTRRPLPGVLPDWSGWLRGLGTADIAAALEHPDLAAYLRAQPDPARARRQAALVLAHERALRTYVAPVSDLAPHVFRAQETHGQGALRPAWETVATGGVSEHVVPGDHFTVLRQPHVRALARDVAAALGGAARPSNSEAGA